MHWILNDADRELFARELESFVPLRVFDAHAHLYAAAHLGDPLPPLAAAGPPEAGLAEYGRRIRELIPGREVEGLFFGFPTPGVDFEAANAWTAAQLRGAGNSRGLLLVHPRMSPEAVREAGRRGGFVGLKPYHIYAPRPHYGSIPEYLPESHVRVAHEEGWCIMLHVVLPRALADPRNQEAIRYFSERYPGARIILAHAARGFNPHHTIEGIGALAGLGNVWFDTSAVTECGAFEAIVRTLGVERLLYGSDFPVSHLRGRCVAVGDSFLWITPETTVMEAAYADLQPVLVGLESLRALRQACWNLRLGDEDVERIFNGNARVLLGL